MPEPRHENRSPCRVSITGTEGKVFVQREPVYLVGEGMQQAPVQPDFVEVGLHRRRSMGFALQRLLDAVDSGAADVPCSGHDYRQALEIAIALKLSAAHDHQRVTLPLTDRSHRIYPHPYRMLGGDVAGYESIGYAGPPTAERVRRPRRRRAG
jgi:hypothetical protein